MSRASSSPLMISISIPLVRKTRSNRRSLFVASRACGNRAQTVNIETLGHMLKTQKSFLVLLDGFFLKIPVAKNILTKAHRQANVLDCVHPPGFIHFADYHTHGI